MKKRITLCGYTCYIDSENNTIEMVGYDRAAAAYLKRCGCYFDMMICKTVAPASFIEELMKK